LKTTDLSSPPLRETEKKYLEDFCTIMP